MSNGCSFLVFRSYLYTGLSLHLYMHEAMTVLESVFVQHGILDSARPSDNKSQL